MTTHPAVSAWLVVAVFLAPVARATSLAQQPPGTAVPPVPPQAVLSAEPVPLDSAPATLLGRVVDSTGAGLMGAEISMGHPERMHIITGDSGQFRITGLRPGSNVFDVRRLGFSAATFTAVLKPGKTHRATFELSSAATPLPLVAISDTAIQSHWLDQFARRKATHAGTFITRPEIVKMNARTGTDIVRHVSGIRVSPGRNGTPTVYIARGGTRSGRICTPQIYIHSTPYSGSLEDIPADDIEALELYLGPSEVPEELDKDGRGYCGAVVVWTRDPKKAP
jgi:hypothetical protein